MWNFFNEDDLEHGMEDLRGLSREELIERRERLGEQAFDQIVSYVEEWDGESINDRLARAILSSLRPMIDVFSTVGDQEGGEMNPVVFQLAVKHMLSITNTAHMLHSLAELRK